MDGEMAELSAISVPALCMLTGGIFAADRRLKWGAYVYMAVPVLLLSIVGVITNIYDRFAAASELSYHFALAAGYTKSFFYILYPAAGYLLAARDEALRKQLAARVRKRCGNIAGNGHKKA